MTFRADLHCHTCCSDGSATPAEIVRDAQAIGLQGLAITDHDTDRGYQEAASLAHAAGLWLGTGAECSSAWILGRQEISVHILAYDFLPGSGSMTDLFERHRARREKRARAMLEKLRSLGMVVEWDELMQRYTTSAIGRPHIAALMIEQGYVSSIQDAFSRYLGEGKPAYVRSEAASIGETVESIRAAGGQAFLAHPHLMPSRSFVKTICDQFSFDGIECYYGVIDPAQERTWCDWAERRHLKISGGSDYHGAAKPYLALGCAWVDEGRFRAIFPRYMRGEYGSR